MVMWKRENGYNELHKFKGIVWLFLAAYSKLDRRKCCGVTACIPQNSYADAQCDSIRKWGGA